MRRLILVNSTREAKLAFKIYNRNYDVLIALTLDAEFYLKSRIESWENPLYKFLPLTGSTCSYNFLAKGFGCAYAFCEKYDLVGIRDRLGYFLSEFDRSYIFAKKVINQLEIREVILGELTKYPGASVINGSLKPHAFYAISKSRGLKIRFFPREFKPFSARKIFGALANKLVYSQKSTTSGKYDLVILAPPRQLLQLANVIDSLKMKGLSVFILTYTVTPTFRKKLNKHISSYFEKETLMGNKVDHESKRMLEKIIKKKLWTKFSYPKYKSDSTFDNFIKSKIENIIKEELLENIKDMLVAQEFFKNVSCSALVTTTDPDSKVVHFISEAEAKKIKTIAIQHGVMWNPAPLSVVPVSNYFVAWSYTSKRWVAKMKAFRDIKIIVGQSPFHRIIEKSQDSKRKKLRILYLVTIVILDTNMIAFYQKRFFEIIAKFGKSVELVVRIHPFQDDSNLRALMANSSLKASFDTNESLQETISNSDLVISEETTAIFDAMNMGKPTIFFNPYSGEDYFEAKKLDYAMTILTLEDIERKLYEYITNRDKWKYYATRGRLLAQGYLGLYNAESDKLARVLRKIVTKNG